MALDSTPDRECSDDVAAKTDSYSTNSVLSQLLKVISKPTYVEIPDLKGGSSDPSEFPWLHSCNH